MSNESRITAEQAHETFFAVAQTEPRLIEALFLAGGQKASDLSSVRAWLDPFTKVMADNPNIAPFRRMIFAHLLITHNEACERATEPRPITDHAESFGDQSGFDEHGWPC